MGWTLLFLAPKLIIRAQVIWEAKPSWLKAVIKGKLRGKRQVFLLKLFFLGPNTVILRDKVLSCQRNFRVKWSLSKNFFLRPNTVFLIFKVSILRPTCFFRLNLSRRNIFRSHKLLRYGLKCLFWANLVFWGWIFVLEIFFEAKHCYS